MTTIKVYDAVCVEDARYGSGTTFLHEGQPCKLQVSETGLTYWVYVDGRVDAAAVFCGQDEDWVWKHLMTELPWKKFDNSKENQHG